MPEAISRAPREKESLPGLSHMKPPANFPIPPAEANDQKKALNEFSELGLPNCTSYPIDFTPALHFLLLLLPHLAQARIQGVLRAGVRVRSSGSEGLEILSGNRVHFIIDSNAGGGDPTEPRVETRGSSWKRKSSSGTERTDFSRVYITALSGRHLNLHHDMAELFSVIGFSQHPPATGVTFHPVSFFSTEGFLLVWDTHDLCFFQTLVCL